MGYCRRNKEDSSLSLRRMRCPKAEYSSKCSAQNYRALYGAAMLVDLFSPPTWRPVNGVNIWPRLFKGWITLSTG